MTLPTFEDMMLPILMHLSDSEEKSYPEITKHLIDHFKLDKEDLSIEKPSGGNYFQNRLGWAKNYLVRAGLLESLRGKFKITMEGVDALKTNPGQIDRKFLSRFEKFNAHVPNSANREQSNSEKSPDDLIDEGMSEINDIMKIDLLEKLKSLDPIFFEKLILDLIEKLGYGKSEHVGGSGDHGIDGKISQDELGLDIIYLQVKRYSDNYVPVNQVRDFIGSLSIKKAQKGIFITTSDFTSNAHKDVKDSDKKIVLINGDQLVTYMIKYEVGVKIKKSIAIKEIDDEYFESYD